MGNKKLYRSRDNKVICGVAGGLAEYLDADPTIVRLITFVACLTGGAGVIAYIGAALIIPLKPYDNE